MGRAAAIRAFLTSYRRDVQGTIQCKRHALDNLPKQDLTWRSTTALHQGMRMVSKGILRRRTKPDWTRWKRAKPHVATI